MFLFLSSVQMKYETSLQNSSGDDQILLKVSLQRPYII